MKNTAFEIPLHEITPPYENMDGAKIRLIGSTTSAIGEMVTSHDEKGKRFGVRVDVQNPIVYHPRHAPVAAGKWEEIGAITVSVIKLSREQIQGITKTDSADAGFELKL